jgi:hypothetical protein
MKKICELRALGYIVTAQPDELSTVITCDRPFWYFNPKWHQLQADIQRNLQPAAPTRLKMYELRVAGLYGDHEPLPYVLVRQRRLDALDAAHKRVLSAQAALVQAQSIYMDTLAEED